MSKMTPQLVKHEQKFVGENLYKEATDFLVASSNEHPDFVYHIQFLEDGILVTGTKEE